MKKSKLGKKIQQKLYVLGTKHKLRNALAYLILLFSSTTQTKFKKKTVSKFENV